MEVDKLVAVQSVTVEPIDRKFTIRARAVNYLSRSREAYGWPCRNSGGKEEGGGRRMLSPSDFLVGGMVTCKSTSWTWTLRFGYHYGQRAP